jgi:nitrate reductase beta subunit
MTLGNEQGMEVDLATQSNPTSVVQRHLSLELVADFDAKVLKGKCTVTAVVLDKAKALADGMRLGWSSAAFMRRVCSISDSHRSDQCGLCFSRIADGRAARCSETNHR